MKKKFLGWAGILFLTLACGLINPATPAQPGVETIVAATMQALTPVESAPTQVTPPTQVPQPDGISVNVENVSLVIPNGLANGAAGEKIPASTEENGAPWEVGPAYIKFTLSSYPLQDTMWSPEIKIYPAEEYRLVDLIVGERMDEVKTIATNPNAALPENLPFLPFVNAGQVFYAQMQAVYFQNGSGIRYVTQFDQAPIPINNQEMFYTYQGLSQDGKYFISATFPINIAFLPADGSPNTPAPVDGVPMDWENFENFPTYLDAVTQKLGSANSDAFIPSLSNLDALIQSITISAP